MIKIVISDSGPLISLANANALDLLLNFEPGVEVVVTDIVYLETTSGRDVHKDAEKIYQFLSQNSGHITIQGTGYGQLLLDKIKSDPNYRLPPDAGEMSIMSYDINSDDPAIVLFEDKWFLDPKRLKASSNIVSTCAFVKVALARNLISQKRYSEIIGTLKMFKRNLQMVETDTEWERSLGNR
jgi:hypothetical protein